MITLLLKEILYSMIYEMNAVKIEIPITHELFHTYSRSRNYVKKSLENI